MVYLLVRKAARVGADAAALLLATLDCRPKMDAAVKPRYGCFVGGRLEAGKAPRLQAVTVPGRILEGEIVAERAGQHRRRSGRLHAVAARIFGKGRRVEQRLPFRIDRAADVGDRPNQVVLELGRPAPDESIGLRHAKARQDVDALLERRAVAIEYLQRDRNPMPRRRGRQHRIIRPETRDRGLLRAQRPARLIDLEGFLVERRRFVLAVLERAGQRAGRALRHGEGAVVAPFRQQRKLLLRDQAGGNPMRRTRCQRILQREAHVFDDGAAVVARPRQDVRRDGLSESLAAGHDIGRQRAGSLAAQFRVQRG